MKKFRNLAEKVDGIVTFFKWVTILGVAGLLILLVAALRMEDAFYENMEFDLSLLYANFTCAEECVPDASVMKILFIGMLILGIVMLAVRYYQIIAIRRIIKPMKEARPFDSLVVKNIRMLSWSILVGDGIFALISFALQIWEYHAFDFENLFLSDKIIDVSAEFNLDINFIWVFLVVYLLSYVFEYGQELQVQSDETL